jgi:hypothetical protein
VFSRQVAGQKLIGHWRTFGIMQKSYRWNYSIMLMA